MKSGFKETHKPRIKVHDEDEKSWEKDEWGTRK